MEKKLLQVVLKPGLAKDEVLACAKTISGLCQDRNDNLYYLGLDEEWVKMVENNILNDWGDNFENYVIENIKMSSETIRLQGIIENNEEKLKDKDDEIRQIKQDHEEEIFEMKETQDEERARYESEIESCKRTIHALQEELGRVNRENEDLRSKIEEYKDWVLDLYWEKERKERG